MEHYYCILINGYKAVNVARRFCSGYCYRNLSTFGQIEITEDEEGIYNGLPRKWVDVSYIQNGNNIPEVLGELSKIGFKGEAALISECIETNSYAKVEELCCVII